MTSATPEMILPCPEEKGNDLAGLAKRLRSQEPEIAFEWEGEKFSTEEGCLVAWGYSPAVPADPEAPAARLFLYEAFEGAKPYLLVTVKPGAVCAQALSLLDGLAVMGRIGAAWSKALRRSAPAA